MFLQRADSCCVGVGLFFLPLRLMFQRDFATLRVAEIQRNDMPVARQLDIQTRLIDAIHDLCFVLSSDNTILYCNRKAAEVFGHSEAQLRGLDFSTFIHDDVRDRSLVATR